MRRSLRGNVDRNARANRRVRAEAVVPYVGTWIEMRIRIRKVQHMVVVPYVGTWIKIDSTPLWVVPLTIFRYKGDKLKKSEGHYKSFFTFALPTIW